MESLQIEISRLLQPSPRPIGHRFTLFLEMELAANACGKRSATGSESCDWNFVLPTVRKVAQSALVLAVEQDGERKALQYIASDEFKRAADALAALQASSSLKCPRDEGQSVCPARSDRGRI